MDYDLADNELHDDALLTGGGNGPTFEDLAIDDSLSDLDRVAKYSCSSIALQRVIHVKMLSDTARSVGFQRTCDVLIPLLEPLVCDLEYVVRQHVALQFPLLCAFLVSETTGEASDGYRVLLDKMIPLVAKLVSDKQHEVRSAASESLVELAALVKPEDQGQYILTIVLPLAHDDDNEQFRIAAISLYHGLAEHLGPELCQQFCVPELISLSEDPVFRVRKSTVQSFASVCKTAGQEVSRERLLPSFQKLSHDDIWAVRKACVESLVSISQSLATSDRGELLIPLFESYLSDNSRWVRLAAYQSLGPFLASLERKDVTDELLQHFLGMATSAASASLGGSGEHDLHFHCAFNLPAIASILGPLEWFKIASTFDALRQDSFWKVRRTFAYSLHELARLLGTEITETQLAPAFDAYLRDIPDVKYGAMVHFADFLQFMTPQFRENYLPVLAQLLEALLGDTTKWRTREILSLQLPQLCILFSEQATFAVIYPLAIKLITDDVAVVRHRSARACPLLVARIAGSTPEWLEDVLANLQKLACSRIFTERQVFALVCEEMLSSCTEVAKTLFETRLAESFFGLASDKVSNVRVVCVQVLLSHRETLVSLECCPQELREVLSDQSLETPEDVMRRLQERVAPRTLSGGVAETTAETESCAVDGGDATGGSIEAEPCANAQETVVTASDCIDNEAKHTTGEDIAAAAGSGGGDAVAVETIQVGVQDSSP